MVAACVSIVLAVLAARNYGAALPAQSRPALLSLFAAGHPRLVEQQAMRAAGEAARSPVGASEQAANGFRELARIDPLNPRPFLYFGALRERGGKSDEAHMLFTAAVKRDPRSLAAHYFLATNSLKAGRIDEGLGELSNLARLNNHTVDFASTFTAYAKGGGSVSALRRFVDTHPGRRDELLFGLASDPGNADLIISLASPSRGMEISADFDWRARLVQSLAAAGDYEGARARWAALGGKPLPLGLASSSFGGSTFPAPFGWTYRAGGAALVEPVADGSLSLLYYGRENAVIADQLAFYRPGTYRFQSRASGEGGGALKWRIICQSDNRPLAEMPIGQAGIQSVVEIPSGCNVQRFELQATAGVTDQNARWTIGPVSMIGAGA